LDKNNIGYERQLGLLVISITLSGKYRRSEALWFLGLALWNSVHTMAVSYQFLPDFSEKFLILFTYQTIEVIFSFFILSFRFEICFNKIY
jgi:hypothetical protein